MLIPASRTGSSLLMIVATGIYLSSIFLRSSPFTNGYFFFSRNPNHLLESQLFKKKKIFLKAKQLRTRKEGESMGGRQAAHALSLSLSLSLQFSLSFSLALRLLSPALSIFLPTSPTFPLSRSFSPLLRLSLSLYLSPHFSDFSLSL